MPQELFGTGTTGLSVEQALDIPVTKFQSGPFGGHQQIEAMIGTQKLDCHPHDADPLLLNKPHTRIVISSIPILPSVTKDEKNLAMNEKKTYIKGFTSLINHFEGSITLCLFL